MVWALVRRGLVAGAVAGLIAGLFAFVVGEPHIQAAIDLEHQHGDALVSRPLQRVGLLLASTLYGIAVGGLFAIAFAVIRGRIAGDDRRLAARLAAALFAAVVLVPALKYPANPPAVGDPETIGRRTILYLTLLVGSLLALVAAARVAAVVDASRPWRRPLAGIATFVVVAGGLAVALPGVDEVPADFPPSLLWEFRLSSLGTQAVLWATLGAAFGLAGSRR
jgi:Probable cobalt transporter subunit (CbtA)